VLTLAGLEATQVVRRIPPTVASRDQQERQVVRRISSRERAQSWVVDYSAARLRAIEWLGDRYLLAKPVNANDSSWRKPPRALSQGSPVDPAERLS
jgi:hypothetical protein